jgi:hypothetical protein
MSHDDRDKQVIGIRGYTVFMRDGDVIITTDKIERNMKPGEALLLLNWLEKHRDELYQAAQEQEQKGSEL